jgi:IS30 family transposase
MKKYKQLNFEQRFEIAILKKQGYSQSKIANIVNVSQSTICREFKRNSTNKSVYSYKRAVYLAKFRNKSKYVNKKISPSIEKIIKYLLKKKYSPEQISGYLQRNNKIKISHTSIYRYIYHDRQCNGRLFENLRRKGKAYKYKKKTGSSRGAIKNRVSIKNRPAVVNEKNRIGDWEIDLVIGKNHSGALITIVERKTLFTVSARIDNKSAKTVAKTTIKLLKPFKNKVLTITSDNGKEFAYHEKIASALNAKFYFADPYCSWQRGLNENTNGLIRQYFPKKTDFRKVSQKKLSMAIKQLNKRPRKKLHFQSPYDIMLNEKSKLVA